MYQTVALLLYILHWGSAQDANCDYYQDVRAGTTYYVYSPDWPLYYKPGVQCRWIANCPSGYNCRLDCPVIELPESPSCNLDRLLISKTGDPQLNAAQTYCGRGSLSAVSTAQRISIGLITSINSSGGRFRCTLVAQRASANPQCSCGERRQNRIVGGEETKVNEYKMMVGLADVRIAQIKCGGVIISNKHVLTAAHCVVDQTPNTLAVVVGEHDVNTGNDTSATQAHRIARFTIHPLYTDTNYDYDIAIITTSTVIQFNDRVGPVCLPFKFVTDSLAGKDVTILGWGTLFPGGPDSNVLRKVVVDVISNQQCRRQVSTVTERQMCTFTPGKDACQDDSGGPLLYTDPATGLLFSVGIVSYGSFCASDVPGINTRVTALLGWIVNNTQVDYCVK